MAIIRTQLALSARASSLDEARAAARAGDEAVAHAERVLAQLLVLARIDETTSGRAMSREPVDLTVLARECTAGHFMRAREAGIDLGFEGDEAILVSGEPALLGELVGNLIDNAIAHAGANAMATVRTYRDDGAVIEVEDNGRGLAEADMARVRRRFTRGAGGTRGTGLGLPIVEEIATLFGGTLSLSIPAGGNGLRARVRLPEVMPGGVSRERDQASAAAKPLPVAPIEAVSAGRR
jgi:two-component system sensor histidine kinase TctE